MSSTFILFLLPLAWSAHGKYVYVHQSMDWHHAQFFCMSHYLDLAPISSERDMTLIQQLVDNYSQVWFGLRRNVTEPDPELMWVWSSGGTVRRFFWEMGQPDMESFGLLINFKWHDAPMTAIADGFVCYDAKVVKQKKTWEEALEYCRSNHTDLVSLSSEGEMLLIPRAFVKAQIDEAHVWFGLRFMAGDWRWMDGQLVEFEAWGENGKPWCPAVTSGCGALGWPGESFRGRDILGWSARDCDEKLYFVCY
ncbi:hypothetical protein WMY93_022835 [Mugilogobius chulae]|uniref:C-type lectin domain-containing protein n=1 Tax=Mugilogobius chulae TaxID=88201 RepID=A0AAW0N968_9GOBI